MKTIPFKLISFITLLFLSPILFTLKSVGNISDIYLYAAPFRYFSKLNLINGVIPLWNPYIFNGTPFLASPQSALFYPLNLIFYFFHLPQAFNIFVIIHIWINALGMHLFLRALKKSQTSSLSGSIIWGFSFFFLSKIAAGHIIHLSGYAMSPYLWLFAVCFLKKPNSKLYLLFLMITSALQFFSGHIQVWLYSILFIVLLFFNKIRNGLESNRSVYLKNTTILLLGFSFISLVQLLPTFMLILRSSRTFSSQILSADSIYNFATSYSMNWNALMTWFNPHFFGNPMNKNFMDMAHPSVYFETYSIYIGTISIVFSLWGLGLYIKNKKFFIPGIVIFFLLLSMGKNGGIYPFLWDLLSFQRVPARFYFLTLLGLVFCFTYVWNNKLKNIQPIYKIILVTFILFDLYSQGRHFIWSEDYYMRMGKSQLIHWLQTEPSNNTEKKITQKNLFLRADMGNQNKSMLFQIVNSNGYEAILSKNLLNYYLNTQGENSLTSTGLDLLNPIQHPYQLLGIQYLITTEKVNVNWPIAYEQNNIKIYKNSENTYPAYPIFQTKNFSEKKELFKYMNSDYFEIKKTILLINQSHLEMNLNPSNSMKLNYFNRRDSNKIEMVWETDSQNSFWILWNESFYPGWEMWSKNNFFSKTLLANGYFQAVYLKESTHHLKKLFLVFRPKDFKIGLIVSILSIVLASVFLLIKMKKIIS